MGCFGLSADSYTLEVLTVLLALATAACYGLGMMEGRAGRAFFYIALALHAASIAERWCVLGWPPVTEKRDAISLMALMAAIAGWRYGRREGANWLTFSSLPVAIALLVVSLTFRPIGTISPFMRTPWFFLHVFFFSISYGLFAVSAVAGVWAAIKDSREHDAVLHRTASYGWLMLSVALTAGSIWFYLAYGTYWLWTSKELWITVTWMYYGMYLHMRLMGVFKGRVASVAGAFGFAVALFSYFGVGTVIPSPPSQF